MLIALCKASAKFDLPLSGRPNIIILLYEGSNFTILALFIKIEFHTFMGCLKSNAFVEFFCSRTSFICR